MSQLLSSFTLIEDSLDHMRASIFLTPSMALSTPNSKALTKNSIASRMSVDCLEHSSWATSTDHRFKEITQTAVLLVLFTDDATRILCVLLVLFTDDARV